MIQQLLSTALFIVSILLLVIGFTSNDDVMGKLALSSSIIINLLLLQSISKNKHNEPGI